MLGINFIYKSQDHIIQYDKSTFVKNVFEEYANKYSLEIENLIFFHNGIRVNLNMEISIKQLFNVSNENIIGNNNEQCLEVLVFDKALPQGNLIDEENDNFNEEGEEIFKKLNNIEIIFVYKKTYNVIKCNPYSSLKDICKQFSDSGFLDMKYLMFIYNGTLLDVKEDIPIINQLNIKLEKDKKYETIEILVFEEFYQIQILFAEINIPYLIEKETIKIKNILEKFEKLTGLKKDNYSFIYGSIVLNPGKIDIQDNILEKNMINILNVASKELKVMTILVIKKDDISSDNSRTNSLSIHEEEIPSEDIIKVNFMYQPHNIVIEAKKDDKLKDIFLKFMEKAELLEIDKNNILFINEKKEKHYCIDTVKKKTLINIMSKSNIFDKEITFIPKNKKYEKSIYYDKNLNLGGDLNEGLLVRSSARVQEISPEKIFFSINFFILAIQYCSVLLTSTYFFIFKINEETFFNINEIPFIVLFILFLLFSFFINAISKNQKTHKSLITFIIFYPALVTYFCVVISLVLEYKYIVIGLSLIFLEKISQGFYALFFKKYGILFFGISSSVLSLIGLILFSIYWIKDLLPIIYVSTFYLCTIGINLLLIYISSKYCENDEYFYSIIIFNYGIFLAFSNVIEKLIIYMKKNYDEAFIEKKILMITFFILIIQYIFIISILWILLSFIRSNFEEYDLKYFHIFFWPPIALIIIVFVLIICFLANHHFHAPIICHVLYIPIMVCCYFSFSFIFEGKYILSFVFIIFFDLITILILYLIFKNEIIMFVGCLITDAIAILLFHFFWLKNDTAIIVIPITSFCVIIYLVLFSYASYYKMKRNFPGTKEMINISIIFFEHGIILAVIGLVVFLLYNLSYCGYKRSYENKKK